MFSFFNEISKISGLPFEILDGGFRVVNFSGKVVYVEGFKSIINFLDDSINLKMKKGVLKISGNELGIKNLNENTILVCGNIEKVESF